MKKPLLRCILILNLVCLLFLITSTLFSADWPQFQCDKQRLGRTTDSVNWPYRPRWIWFGSSNVIRNKLSRSTWPYTIDSNKHNNNQSVIENLGLLPASVPFTFSELNQVIVVNNKVYIGDQEGKVYCINSDDGTTLWEADNSGGTMCAGAYVNGVVVFVSFSGKIRGYDANTGNKLWEVTTYGPVTASPVTDGTVVCVGSHDGHVYCINPVTGQVLWTSDYLGAQIAGGLCMDDSSVYCGAENMMFYALRLNDGSIRLSKHVAGESFFLVWPVVYGGYVFIKAHFIPCHGAEACSNQLIDQAISQNVGITTEEDWVLRWLQGDTNGGAWPDASGDWKYFTVLSTSNFNEPFTVPLLPAEGCGTPPEPVVVDNQGRVLTYWKTGFPKFSRDYGFGGSGTADICGINLTNGRRIVIDNGKRALDDWYTWEGDNLYGMTVGGNILYLRQSWRGVVGINLATTVANKIENWYYCGDCTCFYADIMLDAGCTGCPCNPGEGGTITPTGMLGGRTGPAISGNLFYIVEDFALIAVERDQ